MANTLDQIFGNVDYQGMYNALKNRQLGQLNASTQNAIAAANGQATAGATQANNATTISSNRSNLTAPISAALQGKNIAQAGDMASTIGAGIQEGASNKAASIENNLDNAGIEAMEKQAQGTQQMVGNIVGGLGSIAGALAGV